MKSRIIFALLLLYVSTVSSATSFMDFYNQSSNWSSGIIGSGELVIDDEVILTQDVMLCSDFSILVVEGGQLINNSHQFSLGECGEEPLNELIRYHGSEPETITLNSQKNALVRYLDFGGEDRYVVSTDPVGPVNLVDNQASTILLPVGLTISSAEFTANGVRFTINGQELTLLGSPQEYTFVFAGNVSDQSAGVSRDYAETASVLGAHIPDHSAPPVAATVTGTVQPDGTLLDQD